MDNHGGVAPAPVEEFILLPEQGFSVPDSHSVEKKFMESIAHARGTEWPVIAKPPGLEEQIKVVDSIQEMGPKLVQLSPGAALRIRASHLRFRLAPVREYVLLASSFLPAPVSDATLGSPIGVQVLAADTGLPLADVFVTGFTNFSANIGAQSQTNRTGIAQLSLGASGVTLGRLYVQPSQSGYWAAFERNLHLVSGHVVKLEPLDITRPDIARHFYSAGPSSGQHVRVAVIDTGIDNTHPDLRHVQEGFNAVSGEIETDWMDNGTGHGTHVAGIIGGRGTPPSGVSGLAPACLLQSYRVFGQGQRTTTNYQVLKAFFEARRNRVDVINLSVGGLPDEDVMRAAIEDLANDGIVVIAAAGNDGRKPITAPAKHSPAVAISAFGRRGTYPKGSLEESYEEPHPSGRNADDYIASFSNFGSGIFFTAPGVGVVSCAAGGGARPWSGTSISAGVVSALAAKMISETPALHSSNRDRARTRAIINALSAKATDLGFPVSYQGFGRPG